MSVLPLPRRRPEVIDFLATRRSVSAKLLGGPGPDRAEVEAIMQSAARVPDHRKLEPWRLLVVTEDSAAEWGAKLRARYAELHTDATDKQLAIEEARFQRAPVAVGVVSSPVECVRGTPVWEQELSAGALCYGLVLAAKARGWGASWLTEWMSYDANELFGLKDGERFAGWVYIGTPQVDSLSERPRPDVARKTRWL